MRLLLPFLRHGMTGIPNAPRNPPVVAMQIKNSEIINENNEKLWKFPANVFEKNAAMSCQHIDFGRMNIRSPENIELYKCYGRKEAR